MLEMYHLNKIKFPNEYLHITKVCIFHNNNKKKYCTVHTHILTNNLSIKKNSQENT